MEINGRQVEPRINGKTLILYKQTFKRDMLGSLISDGQLDYVVAMEYLYIFEKQDGHEIPARFNDYVDTLDIAEVMACTNELIKGVNDSIKSKKKTK